MGLKWPPIVGRAAEIAEAYDTGVTLRQLHYRLVSEQAIPNTRGYYQTLSDRTAQARREGRFPDLIDRGRRVEQYATWTSPQKALDDTADSYRRDRTEGQEWTIFLGVEKDGMVSQFLSWFGDLGIPIAALSGYASQSFVVDVARQVERAGRPAILLYAGDFDPTGEDILRDFEQRSACWDKVVRVALSADQVSEYGLPPLPGKTTDSRAEAFRARHGALVQVELDALDPEDLRSLYADAISDVWDTSAYDRVMQHEAAERTQLAELADGWAIP